MKRRLLQMEVSPSIMQLEADKVDAATKAVMAVLNEVKNKHDLMKIEFVERNAGTRRSCEGFSDSGRYFDNRLRTI